MIDRRKVTAFTLFELVVVLAIISAMVAVIVPFVKRSNDGLKIVQQSRDVAQTIRYAIDLAQSQREAVKFTFDAQNNSYWLQQADEGNNFKPVENFMGSVRYLNKDLQLFDIDGFEQSDQCFFLVFDPQSPWPVAELSLATKDLIEVIKVDAQNVYVEETSI